MHCIVRDMDPCRKRMLSACNMADERFQVVMQDRAVMFRDAHGVCMSFSVICAHGYVGFVPEPQLYAD